MKYTPTMRDYQLEDDIKFARSQFLTANAKTSRLYHWHKLRKLKARRSPEMRAWIENKMEAG